MHVAVGSAAKRAGMRCSHRVCRACITIALAAPHTLTSRDNFASRKKRMRRRPDGKRGGGRGSLVQRVAAYASGRGN